MAGGALLFRGHKDRQPLNSYPRFAAAKVIELDQAKRQSPIRIQGVFPSADRRQTGRAFPQKRSRKARRQAVLKIRLRAELHKRPVRELP